MIPRIKKLLPKEGYKLDVTFDSGEHVIYDVMDDINTIKEFEPLLTEAGLFNNVQLDESRTCVFWSDMIDLPSHAILEYGVPADAKDLNQ